MDWLRLGLLVVHILGFAALLGGLLAQLGRPEKRVLGAMRDGVGTAFLAGVASVGVLEGLDEPLSYPKIAVKLGIGLVLLVLVMANTRKPRIPDGLFYGLLLLTVTNVVVAVVWSPVHS